MGRSYSEQRFGSRTETFKGSQALDQIILEAAKVRAYRSIQEQGEECR